MPDAQHFREPPLYCTIPGEWTQYLVCTTKKENCRQLWNMQIFWRIRYASIIRHRSWHHRSEGGTLCARGRACTGRCLCRVSTFSSLSGLGRTTTYRLVASNHHSDSPLPDERCQRRC